MAVYWNDELNAEYVKQRTARVPVKVMAAFFGTTIAAIYAHGRVIDCLIQPHRAWTEDEKAALRQCVAMKMTDKEISVALNRPPDSFRWMLSELELTGIRQHTWTGDDYARLRRKAEVEGRTTAEIAASEGVSGAVIRRRLNNIDLKAKRTPRAPGPRGRPRAERPVVPLTESEIDTVKSMLGSAPLRKIARAIGTVDRKLKLRAAAAGLTIGVSMRRIGEPLTREVIEPLVLEGLTATQAGKRVGRDRRTLAEAAAGFDLVFATRQDLAAKARHAKDTQQTEARAELAARVVARRAAAAHAMEIRGQAAQRDRAVGVVADGQDTVFKVSAAKTKGINATGVKPVAVHAKAVRPAMVDLAASNVTADSTRVAKPMAGPRGAAAPVKVRVLEAPAPIRAAADAAIRKPAHRPFAWSYVPTKPKVVFDQREVDAAVARFIKERGVTRGGVDAVEAAVTAARRLGFVVLRDKEGFVLDGRIKLSCLDDLRAFVARREEAKSQVGQAMTA
jgi:hypothetical protein